MTEVEHAIEMWLDIRYEIECSPGYMNMGRIRELKEKYCEEHGIEWKEDCYFCNKYTCAKCPLFKESTMPERFNHTKGCVDYWIAADMGKGTFPKEERLAACDNIINALRKEVQ